MASLSASSKRLHRVLLPEPYTACRKGLRRTYTDRISRECSIAASIMALTEIALYETKGGKRQLALRLREPVTEEAIKAEYMRTCAASNVMDCLVSKKTHKTKTSTTEYWAVTCWVPCYCGQSPGVSEPYPGEGAFCSECRPVADLSLIHI